jgi:hypothetical protein
MRRLNLDYLVAIEIRDKKLYMQCESKECEDRCIKQGLLVISDMAYYKPTVILYFAGNVRHMEKFETYDEAVKYADKYTTINMLEIK